MGEKQSRRGVLKGLGTSVVALTGISAAVGPSMAWDRVPIDVSCPSCERLGKVEATYTSDGAIDYWSVEDDWGYPGTADGTTFTFDVDGDGIEEVTIKLTNYYFNDGERVGFDYTSNIGLCRVDVKDGGKYENEYKELGAAVRGTELFAPDNPGGDSDPDQLSNIQFYYCPEPRLCILSSDVSFDPASSISVTTDEVRAAVWWGARHYKDDFLFENGVPPTGPVFMGDADGDDVDDVCYRFNLSDAIINNPLQVHDPRKMKISLLIRETDGDNDLYRGDARDGIVALSPDLP